MFIISSAWETSGYANVEMYKLSISFKNKRVCGLLPLEARHTQKAPLKILRAQHTTMTFLSPKDTCLHQYVSKHEVNVYLPFFQ
jgi:hypothetical protein